MAYPACLSLEPSAFTAITQEQWRQQPWSPSPLQPKLIETHTSRSLCAYYTHSALWMPVGGISHPATGTGSPQPSWLCLDFRSERVTQFQYASSREPGIATRCRECRNGFAFWCSHCPSRPHIDLKAWEDRPPLLHLGLATLLRLYCGWGFVCCPKPPSWD